jgi:hypothetical protein
LAAKSPFGPIFRVSFRPPREKAPDSQNKLTAARYPVNLNGMDRVQR